ncbi:UNKNOWN [Stylonychia lemnae]|uniref:Uncharacterized protein n=1 Tax=Stylonychia lemnae TaxID=5949 RepID=A0A078B4V6_STYLE|nr:UNKNOWN [Stylonychia lemnae]|eukprot:CDW89454.1 UNKNOWN [Stylonychia lemnae]
MFNYKPTEYSPTASQRYLTQVESQHRRSIEQHPSLGGSGDPHLQAKPAYLIKKNDIVPANDQSKFLRDTLEIDDINGTRSKRRVLTRNIGVGLGLIGQSEIEKDHFKDTIMHFKDIKGTHPHKDMTVWKDYAFDTYRDVTHAKKNYQKVFQSPQVNQSYDRYTKITQLDPNKIKSEVINQDFNQSGYYTSRVPVSMTVDDIDYSSPGTVGYGPFRRIPRREMRDPIYIDDIEGSRSNNSYRSTLMQSKKEGEYQRNTNPLAPDYQYIGLGDFGQQSPSKLNMSGRKSLLSFDEVQSNKNNSKSTKDLFQQSRFSQQDNDDELNDRAEINNNQHQNQLILQKPQTPRKSILYQPPQKNIQGYQQNQVATNEYGIGQSPQQQNQFMAKRISSSQKKNRESVSFLDKISNNNNQYNSPLQQQQLPQVQQVMPINQYNQLPSPTNMGMQYNNSNVSSIGASPDMTSSQRKQFILSRNRKFEGLDTMRPAGITRGIGIPEEPEKYYYSQVASLPVSTRQPFSYEVFNRDV